MNIIVQKFGGTSLANRETRLLAIEHIVDAVKLGKEVVVVVSAIGRKGQPYATDSLLSLVTEEDVLDKREKDLLMSCGEVISAAVFSATLRGMGYPAVALTGTQAGIETDDQFGDAQIKKIDTRRIINELKKGHIVVVTGFQGASSDGEITTLGRGGSDTTATALGVALHAEWVDVFTDVDGIMTADPRIVSNARQLTHATYTEICNLAYQGAKVIHPRAVEIAMQRNIPIRVRSTMSKDPGTLVSQNGEFFENHRVQDRMVTGITQTSSIVQIKIDSLNDEGDTLHIFEKMANHSISVDFISVTLNQVTYTVSKEDSERAIMLLREMGYNPHVTYDCAKVSAVGAGIAGVPGVMAKIISALTKEGVEILQSADSHTTIWCLVHGKDMEKAVQALHQQFELYL